MILSNIFVRLPAKLVAQGRCVSKPWNALLSQPSFIKSHLDSPFRNKEELYLLFQDLFYFENPFIESSCRTPFLKNLNFIVKIPANSVDAASSVIGSVNGLICFVLRSDPTPVIYIWNPSLSAMLPLPLYTIPSCSNADDIHFRFRFGFDPKTYDYKVVKLACRLERNNITFGNRLLDVVNDWLHVEVFSMRKGCWEVISERFPPRITGIYNEDDEVCVDGHNGHLHCHGYIDRQMRLQTIVAFDLCTERFSEISLPNSLIDRTVHRMNALGVLNGKLCVMSRVTGRKIEVWVMNEYGVAESWVKHHLFSQFVSTTTPYGFIQDNEFLSDPCYRQLALYDSIVAKVKACKIMEHDFYKGAVYVKYVDSPVWVAPSHPLRVDQLLQHPLITNSKVARRRRRRRKKSSIGGPSSSTSVAEKGNSEIDDELNELEAKLSKISIKTEDRQK